MDDADQAVAALYDAHCRSMTGLAVLLVRDSPPRRRSCRILSPPSTAHGQPCGTTRRHCPTCASV
jgi:hypothetical protein